MEGKVKNKVSMRTEPTKMIILNVKRIFFLSRHWYERPGFQNTTKKPTFLVKRLEIMN